MAMNKVFLTLRSSCGRVGQGLLGTGKQLVWDREPTGSAMAHAVLSRVDGETFEVLEVLQLSGADWAEFETDHAEASFVHNVANGQTMAAAMENVPAAIHEASPRKREVPPESEGIETDMQVRAVDHTLALNVSKVRIVEQDKMDICSWGVVAGRTDAGRWRIVWEGGELLVHADDLLDAAKFELRECPLPRQDGDALFSMGKTSTLELDASDWPLLIFGSDSAEADGSNLIAKFALPTGSVGDDERANKAISVARYMVASALACRGIDTHTLEGMGGSAFERSRDRQHELRMERNELHKSLGWIATFCAEHPDWFGKGTPADGAEFEWLDSAQKLVARSGKL